MVISLVAGEEGVSSYTFALQGVTKQDVRRLVRERLRGGTGPKENVNASYNINLTRIVASAYEESKNLDDLVIATDPLLLALIKEDRVLFHFNLKNRIFESARA